MNARARLKADMLARELVKGIDRPKKHVSIIVYKNKILAAGVNRAKTHPKAKEYGYMFGELHSELDAVRKIEPQEGLILVNYRMNRFLEFRNSKPCSKCMPWCLALFREIYYTTNEGMRKHA
tara:strand:- start:674 stop:1039 length:366 start_codon:yes stop_codon:yes gene_type:complete